MLVLPAQNLIAANFASVPKYISMQRENPHCSMQCETILIASIDKSAPEKGDLLNGEEDIVQHTYRQ